jgi:hypothetical protein
LTHVGRSRGVQLLATAFTALGVAMALSATPALAAGPTIRISPASSTVAAAGDSVTVNVIVNAATPIQGAQATVKFDKKLLQITSVTRGTEWSSADLFLGAAAGDIAKANSTGSLANAAATYIAGTVPAGDSGLLVIAFKALACGTATLGLPVFNGKGPAVGGLLLDGNGKTVKVTSTGGTISICGGAAGSPGASESAGTPASDAPSAMPTDSTAPGASPSDLPTASTDQSAAPTVAAPSASAPAATAVPFGSADPVLAGSSSPSGGGSTPLVATGAAIVVAAAGVGAWILRRPKTA